MGEMAECCATPNITTLDTWGYYPNSWQLLAVNSSIAAQVAPAQLDVYDASEKALYGLKPFMHDPAKVHPTWDEAAERNVYISVNLRREASGIEYFGPYAMVWRQSVVRARALVISADDGHWQFACNASLHVPWAKWWWPLMSKTAYDCTAMGGTGYAAPDFHPPAAMNGHELHTLARNAQTFRHLGLSLPRLLVQLLSPRADIEPIEQYMYTEGALLGGGRISDAKAILASFEPLFGTKDHATLVAFCRNYSLPLLWGLGKALSVSEEHWYQKAPIPLGRPRVPVGAPRLLDPETVAFTNLTASAGAWTDVLHEVQAFRETNQETEHSQVVSWWTALSGDLGVVPLFGGECADNDLAFGTHNATGRCVMRNDPQAATVLI